MQDDLLTHFIRRRRKIGTQNWDNIGITVQPDAALNTQIK
jgi:hypothetical protein